MALEWWEGKTETNTADYHIENYKLRVWEEAPENVNNIIKTTQEWGVHFHWETLGPVAEWLNATFHLRVFLESMGPGPDYQFPESAALTVGTTEEDFVGGRRHYERDITIAPVSITPGTYKLVCIIQVYDDNVNEPVPVVGFCEGPMLEFYRPH